MFRFVGDVEQIWHAALHAEGHFVLTDACLDFGVCKILEVFSIQLVESIECLAATLGIDSCGIR